MLGFYNCQCFPHQMLLDKVYRTSNYFKIRLGFKVGEYISKLTFTNFRHVDQQYENILILESLVLAFGSKYFNMRQIINSA